MDNRPPIPFTCAHRPTIGGLVKPWVNIELADGGVDFRSAHRTRAERAITGRLCQVCGTSLRQLIILLGGPDQVRHLMFGEPPLHPECAVYTSLACPMVAGQVTTYPTRPQISRGLRGAVCPTPDCDCGGWVTHDPTDNTGRSTHPWYAVYTHGYTWAYDQHHNLQVLTTPAVVRRVRLVSRPGAGRCWRTVDNALDGYQAPAFLEVPHV